MSKEFKAVMTIDTKKFKSGLKEASRSIKKFSQDAGKQMKGLGKAMMLKVSAPLAAMSAMAVKLFDTQIKAEAKLREAIKANGGQVEATMRNYKAFASEMQRVSTVGDETTLGLLQVAQSMGVTGERAKIAVTQAISLSKALGINEKSAIKMTAALADGDAEMLKRYIPSLKGIKDKSEAAAKASEILKRMFGAVTAEAKAGLGPLTQLSNQFGDLLEDFGKIILEGLNPFIDKAKVLVANMQGMSRGAKILAVAIAGITASLGVVIFTLGLALPLFTTAGINFLAMSAKIITGLAGIKVASIGALWPFALMGVAVVGVIGAWGDFAAAGNLLADSLGRVFKWIGSSFTDYVYNPIRDVIKSMPAMFNKFIDAGKKFVEGFISVLVNLPRWIANTLTRKIQTKLNGIISLINKVLSFAGQKQIGTLSIATKFKDDFKFEFDKVATIADITFKGIKKVGSETAGFLSKAWSATGGSFADSFSKGANKIKSMFSSGIGGAGGGVGSGLDDAGTGTPTGGEGGKLKGDGTGGPPPIEPWKDFASQNKDIALSMTEMWVGVADNMASSFGSSVADMIVDGGNFKDSMVEMFKGVAKTIISTIVSIGVKWAISRAIEGTIDKTANLGKLKGLAAMAAAAAFTAYAGIPFIGYGLGMAAAGTAAATVMSMGAPAIMKEGGIIEGPTNIIAGEAGKEAIIPLDQLAEMQGGGGEQTIILELDGRELTRTVIRNMPREVRIGSGVMI